MAGMKNKLSKFGVIHGVVVLQMLILIAVVVAWSPWKPAAGTQNNADTATVEQVKQTEYELDTTEQAEDVLAAISATKANLTIVNATQARLNITGKKTVLTKLTAAENQTYTSDNRLFVTGEGGIFEIVADANGNVTVVQRAPKQSCGFGGIVEASGVLYVNCVRPGAAYIYAAKVSAEPSFKRIHTLKGTILANGLTADKSGRIYVASTFLGRILRLTPSTTDPLKFEKGEVWLYRAGILTNGIKFANDAIYWTDGALVKRIAVQSDGKPGKSKTLFGAFAFFDDLSVGDAGILVADYIGNAIRSYDLSGRQTGTFRASLSGPSSVARARAPFPAGSLIITERGANRVSLVTP
jgi:hypothetical protein